MLADSDIVQSELEKRRLAGESKAKAMSLRDQLKLAQSENETMKETLEVLTDKVDVLTKLLEQETSEKEELQKLKYESVLVYQTISNYKGRAIEG